MYALAELRAPTGEVVALGHGALIGRLWSADLHVNDARVSEAHAMISLRGRTVRLLALRGRFQVDGRVVSDVELRPGLVVALAEGLALEVVAVRVPSSALAIEAEGIARQVLTGVTSLFGGPRPRLVPGWVAGAPVHVWPTGAEWMRTGEVPITPGDRFDVDGVVFHAVDQPLESVRPTVADPGSTRPITLTARYDTVHVARAGEAVVVITGFMARVISELVIARTALGWEDLARQRWLDGDRDRLRHRWDMQARRLRQKLAAHGLRPDLVRADGSGLVELVLGPDDTVVDET